MLLGWLGAVEVDGVRQVVRVVERDVDDVALLHAQRRARQPRRRTHGAAERREHPEGHELAGIDLLLDLDHFEMEVDFVRVAIAVEIAPEFTAHLGPRPGSA